MVVLAISGVIEAVVTPSPLPTARARRRQGSSPKVVFLLPRDPLRPARAGLAEQTGDLTGFAPDVVPTAELQPAPLCNSQDNGDYGWSQLFRAAS